MDKYLVPRWADTEEVLGYQVQENPHKMEHKHHEFVFMIFLLFHDMPRESVRKPCFPY